MEGVMEDPARLLRRELKEIWNGLPYNYKTCWKILKRDSVFCDYFNAFLSLPAFARPLYYDRKSESLLEVYRDCKIPVVGLTIQAPIPTGPVQELLQQWLLKTRLPLFLKTSLFVEYLLCKQLLRVCGAVPDRDDSEDELTESETEETAESEAPIKERHVLDIAGLDRNSQMSTLEGLTTPLVQVPVSPEPSSVPSRLEEEEAQEEEEEVPRPPTNATDPDRDLIALSSTTLGEGAPFSDYEPTADSTFDMETVTTSAPSGQKSLTMIGPDLTRLPEISSAPVTVQDQTLSPAVLPSPPPPPDSEHQEGTASLTSPIALAVPQQKLLPDVFSSSVVDMLPDSQSDIVSPHVWQKLYKKKKPGNTEVGGSAGTPSPGPGETFNEEFPDVSLTKQDRRILLGSVAAMDGLREFLSRTAGEHLLNLWLDITMIEGMLGGEENPETRVDMIRDLQDKYRTRLSKDVKDRLFRRDFSSLHKLKAQVLKKLQFYWVPRYFQMKLQNNRMEGTLLKLELDEELLKLPFLPSAAVSRSYPSHLTNLNGLVKSMQNWEEMFKEQDDRIISGRLRHVSASIVSSKKDHFAFGIRSDKNAGGPFRRWLQRHDNTELLNMLSMCEEIAQYRSYFERKADRGILKRAGWRIFHTFMAPGATESVGLGPAVTSDIRIALLSTKDFVHYSVFDVARGNVSLFLKRAWKEYIQEDYEVYLDSRPDIMEEIRVLTENRIRQMQGNRINQNRKRYRAHRLRKGKKKKQHTVFDSESETELEDEDFTNMNIPVLGDVVNNRVAMDKFGAWATRSLSGEKLQMYMLWKDLKSFFEINKQSNKHLRGLQAEHIHRTHFLHKDKKAYNFPSDIATRISREQTARPPSPLLTRTMTFAGTTIEKVFDDFVQSLPLAQAALRRRNHSDDMNSSISQQSFAIGGRRGRGRGGKSKKVPGRATPTKELYHRLLNLLMSVSGTWPEELLLFEKYLGEHGPDDGYPLIVNDLHFWVEVQRFKDMHHHDTDSDFIYRKLEAIVDCYLDPQIPTEPPPEKQPSNLSPPISPTPSSKGQSSIPESPVQSKVDITSLTEKTKKLPWAQRKQVDLTVDIGQKISNRMTTPGGHLDKDLSYYDEAQKMVLKELVPFYAGFANQQDAKSSIALSECKQCPPVKFPAKQKRQDQPDQPSQPPPCHNVNRKWIGSPSSDTNLLFPLPSPTATKPRQVLHSQKEHFTFTLEHGVTWTKHIDDDMISATSEDALPTRPDPKGGKAGSLPSASSEPCVPENQQDAGSCFASAALIAAGRSGLLRRAETLRTGLGQDVLQERRKSKMASLSQTRTAAHRASLIANFGK